MRLVKRLFAMLSLSAMFSILFYACKKNSESSELKSQELTRQKILQQLKENNSSFSYTTVLNIKGVGYYSDIDGNIINRNILAQTRTLYDCPDPADDYFSQSVISVKKEFTCGQGYRVEVTYDVSVLYNLLTSNPSNSSQLSRGRLRLKNSGGTVIWQNTSITPVSITNLGVDPSDNTLTKFRVIFKSPYINETTFNNSTSAEPGLFCYTDCSLVPTVTIGYSSQQASSTSAVNTQPCSRIDKVSYNPASGGTPHTISGCNAVPNSCYPYGYIFPDKQQIQVKISNIWVPLKLYWYGTTNTTGNINPTDLWFIDLTANGMTTGQTYTFRYRNNQTSSTYGGPCFTSPNDYWIEENWYIN